jgi:hypothetical protein
VRWWGETEGPFFNFAGGWAALKLASVESLKNGTSLAHELQKMILVARSKGGTVRAGELPASSPRA